MLPAATEPTLDLDSFLVELACWHIDEHRTVIAHQVIDTMRAHIAAVDAGTEEPWHAVFHAAVVAGHWLKCDHQLQAWP